MTGGGLIDEAGGLVLTVELEVKTFRCEVELIELSVIWFEVELNICDVVTIDDSETGEVCADVTEWVDGRTEDLDTEPVIAEGKLDVEEVLVNRWTVVPNEVSLWIVVEESIGSVVEVGIVLDGNGWIVVTDEVRGEFEEDCVDCTGVYAVEVEGGFDAIECRDEDGTNEVVGLELAEPSEVDVSETDVKV